MNLNVHTPCLEPWTSLIGLALASLLASSLLAEDPPEADAAYRAALAAFTDTSYGRAEKELADFILKYPDSARIPEAVLIQAQSRFRQKQYDGVIELLRSRIETSAALRDQYLFWIAESEFARQNYGAAAEVYGDLLNHFPESSVRLEASYGQAMAFFRKPDLERAIGLLQSPDQAFQKTAQNHTNQTLVVQGHLLLAEAHFDRKDYKAVEAVLTELAKRSLTPELEWQRQFRLATTLWADRRLDDALKWVAESLNAATNLPPVRANVSRANALRLQAEILREKKDPEGALATYQSITEIPGIPASQNRQAVLSMVDLLAAQQRFTNALQRLDAFVSQNPQDPELDRLTLTLGELHLKHFYQRGGGARADAPASMAAATNLLQQARLRFDFIINTLTNSPLAGQAHLNRGWCAWEEGQLTQSPAAWTEGQAAFQAAFNRLPKSPDQAVAQFKLADCSFHLQQHTNAITQYERLLQDFADVPRAKDELFEQAMYQILRARIEIQDFAGARQALDRMVAEYPGGSLTDQALYTFGQALLNARQPAPARQVFLELENRFPKSPLGPEAKLAVAQSFVQELNWTNALSVYDQWSAAHTNHSASVQGEFDRAWTHWQAGNETNALKLFTNYVDRFSSSPLAPLAQWWVAEFYLRQGDLVKAELSYLHSILVQNTNSASRVLAYRARLWAAKAAYMSDRFDSARKHLNPLLNDLLNDPSAPSSLAAEAWLFRGDLDARDPAKEKPLQRFEDAINAFSRIPRDYPTNREAPLALARIADCHLQLASEDPSRYAQATNFYFRVITNSVADVTTRSMAEFGLAKALEKQAETKSEREQRPLLEQALSHYQNVVYYENLDANRNEQRDLFWVREAGLAAADVAQRLNNPDQARSLCLRLKTELPGPQPLVDRKLADLGALEADSLD